MHAMFHDILQDPTCSVGLSVALWPLQALQRAVATSVPAISRHQSRLALCPSICAISRHTNGIPATVWTHVGNAWPHSRSCAVAMHGQHGKTNMQHMAILPGHTDKGRLVDAHHDSAPHQHPKQNVPCVGTCLQVAFKVTRILQACERDVSVLV